MIVSKRGVSFVMREVLEVECATRFEQKHTIDNSTAHILPSKMH